MAKAQALPPLPNLGQLQALIRVRAKALGGLQMAYVDGVAAISFSVRNQGIEGWFCDLGGQHYTFSWTPILLAYKQTLHRPAPKRHTLVIPKARQQKLRRKRTADQMALLKDRAMFSCGMQRINRNLTCKVRSPQLAGILRNVVQGLAAMQD